jgi:AraC-like DNA-binding protein
MTDHYAILMIGTRRLDHLPKGDFCTYAKHDFRLTSHTSLHDHTFHELFWVEDGKGWHWINRGKRTLSTGDLVLVRASDVHAFSAMNQGGHLKIVNFAFYADIWKHCLNRYFSNKSIFFEHAKIQLREHHLTFDQMNDLRHAARDLENGARNRLFVEKFLLDVLGILSKSSHPLKNHRIPPWIQNACEKIRQDFNFQGGTQKLSKLACRTPEHVAREFKRHLNKTPTDVVNDARTSFGAMKLATTNDEIIQIALECGLENLSHFYEIFRIRYGMSPLAYRRAQQSALNPIVRK